MRSKPPRPSAASLAEEEEPAPFRPPRPSNGMQPSRGDDGGGTMSTSASSDIFTFVAPPSFHPLLSSGISSTTSPLFVEPLQSLALSLLHVSRRIIVSSIRTQRRSTKKATANHMQRSAVAPTTTPAPAASIVRARAPCSSTWSTQVIAAAEQHSDVQETAISSTAFPRGRTCGSSAGGGTAIASGYTAPTPLNCPPPPPPPCPSRP